MNQEQINKANELVCEYLKGVRNTLFAVCDHHSLEFTETPINILQTKRNIVVDCDAMFVDRMGHDYTTQEFKPTLSFAQYEQLVRLINYRITSICQKELKTDKPIQVNFTF